MLTDGTIPLFTTYSLVDVPSVACALLILRSHLLHENQGCARTRVLRAVFIARSTSGSGFYCSRLPR